MIILEPIRIQFNINVEKKLMVKNAMKKGRLDTRHQKFWFKEIKSSFSYFVELVIPSY
jgi:hypothetical protein